MLFHCYKLLYSVFQMKNLLSLYWYNSLTILFYLRKNSCIFKWYFHMKTYEVLKTFLSSPKCRYCKVKYKDCFHAFLFPCLFQTSPCYTVLYFTTLTACYTNITLKKIGNEKQNFEAVLRVWIRIRMFLGLWIVRGTAPAPGPSIIQQKNSMKNMVIPTFFMTFLSELNDVNVSSLKK